MDRIMDSGSIDWSSSLHGITKKRHLPFMIFSIRVSAVFLLGSELTYYFFRIFFSTVSLSSFLVQKNQS